LLPKFNQNNNMAFLNPFSKKTNKKRKPKVIPKVVADIHEKNSLIISELESSKEIDLEVKSLKIGDYLIGNTIIERKTTSDFVSSMINKRLIQQLNQMKKYKQQMLIIEGDFESLYRLKNSNSVRGFILSLSQQIPIIFTQDNEDTAKYLITLAKQQLKPKIEFTLHSRIPKTIKEQKQYVLEAFPGIGPKSAKKLLKEFKTLTNTLNASFENLEKILKSKARNFKKLLDS
jgi:ERCC4-type nuclease